MRIPLVLSMLLAALFGGALVAGLFTGCTAADRLTGTVCVEGVNSRDIVAENITSENVTAENMSSGTLRLISLPTSDPGIPGMVWSDNGSLRVSP